MCGLEKASGKVIISGEHSVVYGCPALVTSVTNCTAVKIKKSNNQYFKIFLKDIDSNLKISYSDLKIRAKLIENKFQKFLDRKISIKDVLSDKEDLALITLYKFIEQFEIFEEKKCKNDSIIDLYFSLECTSNIPFQSGMGSSSAFIVAILKAISSFYQIILDPQDLYRLCQNIEKFKAGNPSGVDAFIVSYGGTVLFENGKGKTHKDFSLPYQLVHTGIPIVSTGEVVMDVKDRLADSAIWNDFRNVTLDLSKAVQTNDIDLQYDCLEKNQNLLFEIGIVPKKVNDFILDLKKLGIIAKVTGAGSNRGDNAGLVMVFSDQDLTEILKIYEYEKL